MAKLLMKGNEAISEAAIHAGCRFFFGYPITPQNEIPEYMARRMPKEGGTFLQAESEVSAINMVYGAAAAGARVMTSSSSPGISLKMEGISYLAGSELPCVVVNMVRGGPGLGSIQPAQSDYFQATKGGGHGDYRMVVLAPSSVQEACDMVMQGFDIADEFRMPVMILGDGMIGQMMEPVEFKQVQQKTFKKDWAATGYDGTRKRAVINSLYIVAEDLEKLNKRLQEKYSHIEKTLSQVEEYHTDGAELIIAAYGTMARVAKTTIMMAEETGLKVGLIRPKTVWPFPAAAFEKIAKTDNVKAVMSLEMSAGQMIEDVKLSINGLKPVHFYGKMGGIIPNPADILQEIQNILGRCGK